MTAISAEHPVTRVSRPRIVRFLESLLPGAASRGESLRRGRVLLGFCFVGPPVGFVYAAEYVWLGCWVGGIACASGAVVCLLLVEVLRRTARLALVAHSLALLLVGLAAFASTLNDGYRTAGLTFLLPVVLIAALTISRRAALGYTLLIAVTSGAVYVFAPSGQDWQVHASRSIITLVEWTGIVGVALMITALAYLYDLGRSVLEAETEELVELRRSNMARMASLGALAAGIAHDFNNALTVIMSSAELALLDHEEGQSSKPALTMILDAARSATELTRQLMVFSRRGAAAPELQDLRAVFRTVEVLLRRTFPENLQLELSVSPDLPAVRAADLERLILNLAINARDAARPGGRVSITARAVDLDAIEARPLGLPPGRYAELWVSDDGSGIPSEKKERIFEPYVGSKSGGLALAICYGIVIEAGGAMSVDSDAGRGSTFRVHLPAVEMELIAPTA